MMHFRKNAEAGIGTLILFIAMILVAAVAAGVLIQTSSSLQSKSLEVGNKAQSSVSTHVMFLYVWGEDGLTGAIDKIYAKIKLTPGSDPISLYNSRISLNTEVISQQMVRYDSTLNCSVPPQSMTLFGVSGKVRYYQPGYLLDGDVVDICFLASMNITEGKEVRLAFTPPSSQPSSVSFSTPDLMTQTHIQLFP